MGTSAATSQSDVLRTFVTFAASFPDDGVFDAAGNPQVPGGKNVSDAIVGLLRDRGAEVTEPVQHSFYGWQFTLNADGDAFVFLLQHPETWLLFSRRVESLLNKFRSERSEQTHRRVLEQVSTLLSQDGRFRRQSWFTKDEYEKDSNAPHHEKP
jgi:hypothetical protein